MVGESLLKSDYPMHRTNVFDSDNRIGIKMKIESDKGESGNQNIKAIRDSANQEIAVFFG